MPTRGENAVLLLSPYDRRLSVVDGGVLSTDWPSLFSQRSPRALSSTRSGVDGARIACTNTPLRLWLPPDDTVRVSVWQVAERRSSRSRPC